MTTEVVRESASLVYKIAHVVDVPPVLSINICDSPLAGSTKSGDVLALLTTEGVLVLQITANQVKTRRLLACRHLPLRLGNFVAVSDSGQHVIWSEEGGTKTLRS